MTSYPTLLGTGGHQAASQPYNAGNYYSNVGLGRCAMKTSPFTTESHVSQIIRVPGTVSNLSWGLDSDTFDADLTLTLNVNSSNTLAISIPAMHSGWLSDTDSVTVHGGDTLDFVTNVAETVTYSESFYCASALFEANTGSAQLLSTVGGSQMYTATTTQKFVCFLGILTDFLGGDSTESNQQFYCLAGGIWQNMACYIEVNQCPDTLTFYNRKNGSNGLMSISIPSGHMGYFEDVEAGNKDSVSVGDLLDYGFSTPQTGGFTMAWIGAHFFATSPALCMIGGSEGGQTTFGNGTNYSSLFGGGEASPTIPRATGKFPYALKASMFANYLTAADPLCATTFTLLKNGSASTLAISSSAGQSGYFIDNDNTHAVNFAAGDTCANRFTVVAGGAGETVTWAYGALVLDAGG